MGHRSSRGRADRWEGWEDDRHHLVQEEPQNVHPTMVSGQGESIML